MFTSPYPLELTAAERTELQAMSRSRTIAAGLAQRARVILAIAAGEPYASLSARLELSTTALTRWRRANPLPSCSHNRLRSRKRFAGKALWSIGPQACV